MQLWQCLTLTATSLLLLLGVVSLGKCFTSLNAEGRFSIGVDPAAKSMGVMSFTLLGEGVVKLVGTRPRCGGVGVTKWATFKYLLACLGVASNLTVGGVLLLVGLTKEDMEGVMSWRAGTWVGVAEGEVNPRMDK